MEAMGLRFEAETIERIAKPVPANRLYDQAARLAGFGAWECDLATEELIWTEGVYALFDWPTDKPLKRAAIVDFYVGESRHAMEVARAEALRTRQSFTLEAEIRTRLGTARWMRLSIDVACANGRPTRLFGAKQDITREREAREHLRHMAERDSLTGLANRAFFDARYRETVADDLHNGCVAALALVDLDHFKAINDALGHAAGDECLRQVARRLRRVFDDTHFVARIGGDEFAVMLRGPLALPQIRQMLRRALNALCRPILWNGQRIDVGASIGVTMIGRAHAGKRAALFAEADAALYAAKAAGRKSVHVFGEAPAETATPLPARKC